MNLKCVIEACFMAADEPLSVEKLMKLFPEDEKPNITDVKKAIEALMADTDSDERGIKLVKVASGYRYQVKPEYAQVTGRLWDEKPPKFSRAFLETLVLIAYRQPITRGEIEEIRGVAVSSHIVRTMLEREWVRIVGHKEVPGRPALLATTKTFLDYFGLQSLDELPPLSDIKDLDQINLQLALGEAVEDAESEAQDDSDESGDMPQAVTVDGTHHEHSTETDAQGDEVHDSTEVSEETEAAVTDDIMDGK